MLRFYHKTPMVFAVNTDPHPGQFLVERLCVYKSLFSKFFNFDNFIILRRNRRTTANFYVLNMSRRMGKPTICIGKNKGADQRLCFRYMDSTIPVLSKSKISSLLPCTVTVQLGLCRTWSEPKLLVFSRTGSYSLSTRNCRQW